MIQLRLVSYLFQEVLVLQLADLDECAAELTPRLSAILWCFHDDVLHRVRLDLKLRRIRVVEAGRCVPTRCGLAARRAKFRAARVQVVLVAHLAM